MAKTQGTQQKSSKRTATKAFERAWKLLGQLEKRLAAARSEESKRRRQLLDARGDEVARRQGQLDAAVERAGKAAALLTELSEMIAANARARARQTVSDVAHEAAKAVRDEARAKIAAQAAASAKAPVKSPARPRASRVKATATPDQPAAAPPATIRPAVRRTRLATTGSPARTPAAKRSTTPVRPRSRRSLQPRDGDPGGSSS
jgi:hypothetical protein